LLAKIRGPEKTPYEKGVYQVIVELHEDYPLSPPSLKLITPIVHPEI